MLSARALSFDDFVVMRLAEDDRVGLDERVAVLRECAACRDQEILVLRNGLEQRFVELERECDRVANELEVIVPRERVAGALRQRVATLLIAIPLMAPQPETATSAARTTEARPARRRSTQSGIVSYCHYIGIDTCRGSGAVRVDQ